MIEEHLAHPTISKKHESYPNQAVREFVLSSLDFLHETHQVAHRTRNHLIAQVSCTPLFCGFPEIYAHAPSPPSPPKPSRTTPFHGLSKIHVPSPRTHTHTHTQLYLYYQYLIAPPNNSQTMSQFMQPLAETLQLYIGHSKYFIQDLESLPPHNATQIMFSLLFHIFYTTYPLGASNILSCHETDHSDSNSAPPQIIILQHLIPIPTLPPL